MARVGLVYPKMPGSGKAPLARCVAFVKYDGTNLHWVWDREEGWILFGTRRNQFPLNDDGIAEFWNDHKGLDDAPDLFRSTYANDLEQIFRENEKYQSFARITVFTEYLGPRSFGGVHHKGDTKELMLFDVMGDQQLISPFEFVDDFGHLKIAKVVYRGKLTGKFTEDVREGKYNVDEGVVCKGGTGSDVWMVKVKTYAYQEKLKETFGSKWQEYWE